MNEGPVLWPGRHRLSAVRSGTESQEDAQILPPGPQPADPPPTGPGSVSYVQGCMWDCAGKEGRGRQRWGPKGTSRRPEVQRADLGGCEAEGWREQD